jgi:hypothetical protein
VAETKKQQKEISELQKHAEAHSDTREGCAKRRAAKNPKRQQEFCEAGCAGATLCKAAKIFRRAGLQRKMAAGCFSETGMGGARQRTQIFAQGL